MKVFIYWNLHKKCWSVRDQKTKRVIKHLPALTLAKCKFKVLESGRQRVIRTGVKNVHAGVIGVVLLEDVIPSVNIEHQVRYNPKTQATFTVNNIPVYSADVVRFYPDKTVTIKHASLVFDYQ
jgi:hypothetical protein